MRTEKHGGNGPMKRNAETGTATSLECLGLPEAVTDKDVPRTRVLRGHDTINNLMLDFSLQNCKRTKF